MKIQRKTTSALALLLLLPLTMLVGADSGPVQQAVITTAIDSKAQPVSNLSSVDSTVGNVVFFTEVVGLAGQTITHRWIFNGNEIATINIRIRGNSSKNWSSTTLASHQTGTWEAQVVDSSGTVLVSRTFEVTAPRQRSVQKRLQERLSNDCQSRIADLESQLEENPESTYLQFLLKQQQSRCN